MNVCCGKPVFIILKCLRQPNFIEFEGTLVCPPLSGVWSNVFHQTVDSYFDNMALCGRQGTILYLFIFYPDWSDWSGWPAIVLGNIKPSVAAGVCLGRWRTSTKMTHLFVCHLHYFRVSSPIPPSPQAQLCHFVKMAPFVKAVIWNVN